MVDAFVRFVGSFVISLLAIITLLDYTDNNFFPSFVISLIIAMLVVKMEV